MIVKGYMEENAKAMKKMRDLEQKVKTETSRAQSLEKELQEFKLKQLKERKGLFVEENDDEVSITANNVMGAAQSISLKQLQDLRDTLKRLQLENDSFKRDQANQTGVIKAQIEKLKEEKDKVEKQLFETEFNLGNQQRENEKLTAQSSDLQRKNEAEIEELKQKIKWFRENQKLLSDGDEQQKSTFQELNEMK